MVIQRMSCARVLANTTRADPGPPLGKHSGSINIYALGVVFQLDRRHPSIRCCIVASFQDLRLQPLLPRMSSPRRSSGAPRIHPCTTCDKGPLAARHTKGRLAEQVG